MLSRCFKDDVRTSNDKMSNAPPPACLSLRRWRKPTKTEIAKVTQDIYCAITGRAYALSIKQRVRNRCRLQVARFYEDLGRPGMLLNRQHPRRSQYAPEGSEDQKDKSL